MKRLKKQDFHVENLKLRQQFVQNQKSEWINFHPFIFWTGFKSNWSSWVQIPIYTVYIDCDPCWFSFHIYPLLNCVKTGQVRWGEKKKILPARRYAAWVCLEFVHTYCKYTTTTHKLKDSNLNSPNLHIHSLKFFLFWKRMGGGGDVVRGPSCQTPSPLCFSQCVAGIVWRARCVPAATDCGPSLPRSRALEAAIIWTPASLRHMGNYWANRVMEGEAEAGA